MIVRIAARALLRNKTRSFLTMLGIIIGVAAVITMVALGTGAQNKVTSSISSMGTNTVTVSAGSITQGGVRTGAFGSTALTIDDCNALKEGVPELVAVTPFTQNTAQVIYQEQNWSTAIVGINAEYQSIKNWVVSSGRFITDDDCRGCQKVCVLGATLVEELFPTMDPVGQSVRIGRTPMKVVGVLEAKGDGSFGQSQDDTVLVPYTTAMRRLFHMTNVRNIQCSAVSESKVDTAVENITEILRQRHRLSEKDDDDFTVRTQAELSKMMSESTQTFTMLLGGIASVSLMVGGIGIMNIMLVSVTERIREIGIRMALGARSRDILRQFLVEAMMLSVMGGAFGVMCAWGLTLVGSQMFSMTMTISTSSVLLAFLFSAGVGVFFGMYPAVSASKMDPIDALRHE